VSRLASFTCTNDFLRQGLAHILDRVADHYSVSPLPNLNKVSNSTESDSDSGFVSPASVALPLARLLPILSAVLDDEGGEPWLNHLQVKLETQCRKYRNHH